mmetsp:Transcript_14005/g.42726  ORF Transcript_14005/g.42726 Transcript_14005/m.42726 type:complete len:254 (-) Transcript_14005:210-971(-)|eukprot:scaffold54795_cov28-Tisochrysis_lutea.AAC.1
MAVINGARIAVAGNRRAPTSAMVATCCPSSAATARYRAGIRPSAAGSVRRPAVVVSSNLSMFLPKVTAKAPSAKGLDSAKAWTSVTPPVATAQPPPNISAPQIRKVRISPTAKGLAMGVYMSATSAPIGKLHAHAGASSTHATEPAAAAATKALMTRRKRLSEMKPCASGCVAYSTRNALTSPLCKRSASRSIASLSMLHARCHSASVPVYSAPRASAWGGRPTPLARARLAGALDESRVRWREERRPIAPSC